MEEEWQEPEEGAGLRGRGGVLWKTLTIDGLISLKQYDPVQSSLVQSTPVWSNPVLSSPL